MVFVQPARFCTSVAFTKLPKPTKGFVVVADGHFKSEFDTVDAVSTAGRKLKSTYPMLQIEIYDAATKARTLLSKET